MHLLDTDIVLELRHARAGGTDKGLVAWATAAPRTSLFVSAVTLLELEAAVARGDRKDKAGSGPLRAWLDGQVLPAFDGRILPIDAAVVRRRAQLPTLQGREALQAAVALEHGLTLVTRNVAAFKASRVKVFNPWGYKPEALGDEEDWGQVAKASSQWLRNIFVRG